MLVFGKYMFLKISTFLQIIVITVKAAKVYHGRSPPKTTVIYIYLVSWVHYDSLLTMTMIPKFPNLGNKVL
jgi:hypothetical protein